jgi:hypothetical protein
MTKHGYYYAIEYAYGVHVLNRAGLRADRVYRFASRAARNAWCSQGPTNCDEARRPISRRPAEIVAPGYYDQGDDTLTPWR